MGYQCFKRLGLSCMELLYAFFKFCLFFYFLIQKVYVLKKKKKKLTPTHVKMPLIKLKSVICNKFMKLKWFAPAGKHQKIILDGTQKHFPATWDTLR